MNETIRKRVNPEDFDEPSQLSDALYFGAMPAIPLDLHTGLHFVSLNHYYFLGFALSVRPGGGFI